MAEYAPVAPAELLNLLWLTGDFSLVGSYHLPLVHDVIRAPDQYRGLFTWVRKNFWTDCCIILDNSLIELGEPADFDSTIEAIDICEPNHVVLPDFLGKAEETYEASLAFSNDLQERIGDLSFIAVPQGESQTDIMKCAQKLYTLDGVNAWGVPRWITDEHGTRKNCIGFLNRELEMPIHLLGYSENLNDDYTCLALKNVRGIDSAVPVRMGLARTFFSLFSTNIPPRGTFWEDSIRFAENASELLSKGYSDSTSEYQEMRAIINYIGLNIHRARAMARGLY